MPVPVPTADLAACYPSARDLAAAARAGDWARMVWIMNSTDPSERTGLAMFAQDIGAGPLARAVLDRDPADPLAAAVVVEDLTVAAWDVRGSGRAETVGEDQADRFEQLLQRSDQVLHEAVAHNPNDPTVWAVGLGPVLGLGHGIGEAEYRYGKVKAFWPHVRAAQQRYLQILCPKWWGSWELAEAFAESCLRESPPGTLDAVAVAEVQLERLIDLDRPGRLAYLKDGPMRAQVARAAEHSVWHPQFVPRWGWVRVLHTFATCFALLGERSRAVALLDRCGPFLSDSPWNYFGRPAELIARARAGKPLIEKRRR